MGVTAAGFPGTTALPPAGGGAVRGGVDFGRVVTAFADLQPPADEAAQATTGMLPTNVRRPAEAPAAASLLAMSADGSMAVPTILLPGRGGAMLFAVHVDIGAAETPGAGPDAPAATGEADAAPPRAATNEQTPAGSAPPPLPGTRSTTGDVGVVKSRLPAPAEPGAPLFAASATKDVRVAAGDAAATAAPPSGETEGPGVSRDGDVASSIDRVERPPVPPAIAALPIDAGLSRVVVALSASPVPDPTATMPARADVEHELSAPRPARAADPQSADRPTVETAMSAVPPTVFVAQADQRAEGTDEPTIAAPVDRPAGQRRKAALPHAGAAEMPLPRADAALPGAAIATFAPAEFRSLAVPAGTSEDPARQGEVATTRPAAASPVAAPNPGVVPGSPTAPPVETSATVAPAPQTNAPAFAATIAALPAANTLQPVGLVGAAPPLAAPAPQRPAAARRDEGGASPQPVSAAVVAPSQYRSMPAVAASQRDDSVPVTLPAAAAPEATAKSPLPPRTTQDEVPPAALPAGAFATPAGQTATDAPTPAAVVPMPYRAAQVARDTGVVVAHRLADGAREVTISMQPADFGRIDVRMSFDDTGKLRATVGADNPVVLDLLRRDVAHLIGAMSDAGISSDQRSFRFESQADNGQGQRPAGGGGDQPREQRQSPDRSPFARYAADDRDPGSAQPLRRSGQIDVKA